METGTLFYPTFAQENSRFLPCGTLLSALSFAGLSGQPVLSGETIKREDWGHLPVLDCTCCYFIYFALLCFLNAIEDINPTQPINEPAGDPLARQPLTLYPPFQPEY